ncbi:transcription antitermination factor NusB [Thermovenabulum sp.]|uniref:transcription antitermination factor NusB n=1 Tax=Thermovenabulum sp. TaxID=3100335 RepID=UPI003C7A8DC6
MTRRSAREIIFKMLFAYESGENTPEESLSIAWEKPIEEKDKEYILRVFEGVIKNLDLIDGIIQKYTIDWKLERLLLTDKTLLRLAIYEILFLEEIPEGVSINEAVELAKVYGDLKSPKFINGVLGAIVRDLDKIKENI